MKLTANQLIEINKGIQDIDKELEWDNHGEGEYLNLSEEIYTNGFLVVFTLDIKGSAQKLTTSAFMEENVYSQPRFNTEVNNIRVYDEDGERLTMLPKHYRSINHNLLLNILPS